MFRRYMFSRFYAWCIHPTHQPTNQPSIHACMLLASIHVSSLPNIMTVITFSYSKKHFQCDYFLFCVPPDRSWSSLSLSFTYCTSLLRSLEIGYLKCALTILNALNGSINRECNQRRKILYLSVVVTVGDGWLRAKVAALSVCGLVYLCVCVCM